MGWLSLLLLGCTPEGALTGRLVDARTGRPIAGGRVALSPVPPDGCASESMATDEDGVFVVQRACAAAYRVSLGPPYALAEPVEVSPGAPVDLRAWVLPPADGVWLLHGGELLDVPSNTTLDTLPLLDAPQTTVRLPTEVPSRLPHVDGADLLVLRGPSLAEARIEPLVPSPARLLGPAASPVTMGPWSYVGVTFDESGRAVPAAVTPSAAAVADVTLDGTPVRTLAADAVPPGTYALTYGAARAVLFAIGPEPAVAEGG